MIKLTVITPCKDDINVATKTTNIKSNGVLTTIADNNELNEL